MRVLLDHCVPKRLGTLLRGHEVFTAHTMGWSDLTNGRLLEAAASSGFDAMITVDKGFAHQHNLAKLPVAVVLLAVANNRFASFEPFADAILALLGSRPPKSLHRLEQPK